MSCIIYMVICNPTTHATCSLAFTTYKYNELQVSFAIQKLSCKANCKTPFFFIVNNYFLMSIFSLIIIYSFRKSLKHFSLNAWLDLCLCPFESLIESPPTHFVHESKELELTLLWKMLLLTCPKYHPIVKWDLDLNHFLKPNKEISNIHPKP